MDWLTTKEEKNEKRPCYEAFKRINSIFLGLQNLYALDLCFNLIYIEILILLVIY